MLIAFFKLFIFKLSRQYRTGNIISQSIYEQFSTRWPASKSSIFRAGFSIERPKIKSIKRTKLPKVLLLLIDEKRKMKI